MESGASWMRVLLSDYGFPRVVSPKVGNFTLDPLVRIDTAVVALTGPLLSRASFDPASLLSRPTSRVLSRKVAETTVRAYLYITALPFARIWLQAGVSSKYPPPPPQSRILISATT